jgi:hypothetical protein
MRTGHLVGTRVFLQDYYSEDCSSGWSQDVRRTIEVTTGDLGGTTVPPENWMESRCPQDY